MSLPSNSHHSISRRGAATSRFVMLALGVVAVAAVILAAYASSGRVARAAPMLQAPATPTLAPRTRAVTGLLRISADTNGVFYSREARLPNAVIQAEDVDTRGKVSMSSAADGKYRLKGTAPAVYRAGAVPPAGYALASQESCPVAVAGGAFVTRDFGARSPQMSTPSSTSPSVLDPSEAERVYCGGVYSGDTRDGQNNVSSYSCAPWWDESGNEKVYRLEVGASQPVTVTLLTSSPDLDLFLLRYVYPDSCLAAGDTHFTYPAEPGVYFLSVDGYGGASGPYSFRVDCPLDERATATPTLTPSATPTATPTGPATATSTATVPIEGPRLYLPLVWRTTSGQTGPAVTLTLQDELNGYAGTSDTTLDSWTPSDSLGAENRLRLFYGSPPKPATQKSPAIKFDLSLIPPSAEVRSARLRLFLPSAPAYDVRVAAHGVLRPWDEGGATWNEAQPGQPWAERGASKPAVDRTEWVSVAQHLVEGARWYEFDVTALAQRWIRQPSSNHGMVLTALAGDSDASVEARFTSREGSGGSRPQFIISYALSVAAGG